MFKQRCQKSQEILANRVLQCTKLTTLDQEDKLITTDSEIICKPDVDIDNCEDKKLPTRRSLRRKSLGTIKKVVYLEGEDDSVTSDVDKWSNSENVDNNCNGDADLLRNKDNVCV